MGVLCYCNIMLLGYYVVMFLCYCNVMLLGYYVVVLLCYCNVMLLGHHVVVLLCYQGITLLQYHNRAYFTYTLIINILQSSLSSVYNFTITIYILYRLICNICKSGCHSSIQHKTFNIEYLNYRPITKYQALHSHDIQLCIQVCHKQTDIYIFHQVNTTLFYSYKWAWSHNPL